MVKSYKESLYAEYEGDMRRKQQNSLNRKNKNQKQNDNAQYIPKDLGKASSKLTRMSKEEVE